MLMGVAGLTPLQLRLSMGLMPPRSVGQASRMRSIAAWVSGVPVRSKRLNPPSVAAAAAKWKSSSLAWTRHTSRLGALMPWQPGVVHSCWGATGSAVKVARCYREEIMTFSRWMRTERHGARDGRAHARMKERLSAPSREYSAAGAGSSLEVDLNPHFHRHLVSPRHGWDCDHYSKFEFKDSPFLKA